MAIFEVVVCAPVRTAIGTYGGPQRTLEPMKIADTSGHRPRHP